jgi:hypothetical protein
MPDEDIWAASERRRIMFGDYFFIVSGLLAAGWGTAMILWVRFNPDRRPPLILLGGPVATGLVAVAEGLSRVT